MRRAGIFLQSVALTLTAAFFLSWIFKPVYLADGKVNYLLMWICIGFPFGDRNERSFLCLEGGSMREAFCGVVQIAAVLSLVICYSALVVASGEDDVQEDTLRRVDDGKKTEDR